MDSDTCGMNGKKVFGMVSSLRLEAWEGPTGTLMGLKSESTTERPGSGRGALHRGVLRMAVAAVLLLRWMQLRHSPSHSPPFRYRAWLSLGTRDTEIKTCCVLPCNERTGVRTLGQIGTTAGRPGHLVKACRGRDGRSPLSRCQARWSLGHSRRPLKVRRSMRTVPFMWNSRLVPCPYLPVDVM